MIREKIEALVEEFKKEYGLDVKIALLAFDNRNPEITAHDAIALRDAISLRANLETRFATHHTGYFVVCCTEPYPARVSVSIYCADEWPERLLGPVPEIGLSKEEEDA